MLEAKDVSVFYGSHHALADASVTVDRSEIVVMLGSNGAGKSTLLQAIAGLTPTADGSTIKIDGVNITGKKPDEIVEAGIALVPEDRGIFADLTVQENLLLGAYPERARAHETANLERVLALFPVLDERRDQLVRTMSGGERQMVAIGRAMMSHPSILMLDEPSLGLSPILCSELFRSLKDVKETGVGIFLVEQNAKQSLAIADRGYLLDNGHITGADTATALASDEAVINAYLGGKEPKGKASIQPRVQASALPVETSNAIQAGRRAIVRTPIEELLPHSVSDLVRHATLTQSEHVGANRAISSNGNGKDTAKVNGDISNKAEAPELDDLQKMLLQMEKAAADTLSGSKG